MYSVAMKSRRALVAREGGGRPGNGSPGTELARVCEESGWRFEQGWNYHLDKRTESNH